MDEMDDTINLSLQNKSSEWFETLDKEDQNLRGWPFFQIHRIPISACGRFAFILSKNGHLQVIDTFNGISTKLDFVGNKDKIFVSTYLSQLLYPGFWFYPTSFYKGVLFWTENSGEFNLWATKVHLDFDEKTFKQVGRALKLKSSIVYTWTSQLVPEKTALLFTMEKNLNEQQNPPSCRCEMQQFDLNTLKFYGPKVCTSKESASIKFFPNFYKNRFYDFELTQEIIGLQIRGNGGSFKIFETINCYDIGVGDGKQQKIQLVNDLKCLGVVEEGGDVQFNGVWRNNLLYFQFSVFKNWLYLPSYQHYFAVFNLDTFQWKPISFKFKSQHLCLTSIPMAMSITNDYQMLLIKSIGVVSFDSIVRGSKNLPLYDSFVNIGGHAHCSVHRIPLRIPDSLQLLTLQSVNKMNPNWKSTKSGTVISSSLHHKPLTNNHQHSHHSGPIIYKPTGIYVCNQCESKNTQQSHLQRTVHFFLKNLYSTTRFFKGTWPFWLLILFVVLWIRNVIALYFELSSMDQNIYEQTVNFHSYLCQHRGGLFCLISKWTGVEVRVLDGIKISLIYLCFYITIYYLLVKLFVLIGDCFDLLCELFNDLLIPLIVYVGKGIFRLIF